METILRGAAIYLFLLVVFRAAGKRTLAQTTTFDLVLLLIISETTQQAMVDDDNSMTNGFLLILTLIGLDILLSKLKMKFPKFDRVLEPTPLVVVNNGEILKDRLEKLRIDESDILTAAREVHGLERLDQIKFAVVEESGDISVVPYFRPSSL